eukprot:CAMPEP_0179019676 /NCGR_PEP_ID=MMETSP0796-20121207/4990_1 /TAXON_ID=73915 /ORGANISM="Pyrodinium bahamense, Strain pbaha01" /LENGTH=158 /DNA_ID=CAMNT_0020715469 /DNA_START=26 /DNA_END=498 /DNA_ORIENTATION=-
MACDLSTATVHANRRCSLELWTANGITRGEALTRCLGDNACKGLMWFNNDGGDGRTAQRGWYQGCGGTVGVIETNDWTTYALTCKQITTTTTTATTVTQAANKRSYASTNSNGNTSNDSDDDHSNDVRAKGIREVRVPMYAGVVRPAARARGGGLRRE